MYLSSSRALSPLEHSLVKKTTMLLILFFICQVAGSCRIGQTLRPHDVSGQDMGQTQNSKSMSIFIYSWCCYRIDNFVSRSTCKLASLWFPRQKVFEIFQLGFGLLQKINSVANKSLGYLHALFTKIIYTN